MQLIEHQAFAIGGLDERCRRRPASAKLRVCRYSRAASRLPNTSAAINVARATRIACSLVAVSREPSKRALIVLNVMPKYSSTSDILVRNIAEDTSRAAPSRPATTRL